MTPEELEEYLIDTRVKLVEKGVCYCWVMCDRADFKPIKLSEADMKKHIIENLGKYKGKRIANIRIADPQFPKKNIKDKDILIRFATTIFKIQDDGSLKVDGNRGIEVNYMEEDLQEHKFKIKHVERFMCCTCATKL